MIQFRSVISVFREKILKPPSKFLHQYKKMFKNPPVVRNFLKLGPSCRGCRVCQYFSLNSFNFWKRSKISSIQILFSWGFVRGSLVPFSEYSYLAYLFPYSRLPQTMGEVGYLRLKKGVESIGILS